MNRDETRVDELEAPIPEDLVPQLPSPEAGLAQLLAGISPPTALTYSTPWVRVPVVAVPAFSAEELAAHCEQASTVWSAGWTLKEQQRVNLPLDDRATTGARYNELASVYPWLTLALERSGLGWEQALLLGEWLTEPPLGWFDLEQAAVNDAPARPWAGMARTTTDIMGPKTRVLTPYRHVAVAALHDVGAESTGALGAYPPDRHGKPSRLVWAGVLHGVTDAGGTNPERGAAKALRKGRRLLHALGAWPWACEPSGALQSAWWEDARFVEVLDRWRQQGETQELVARWNRGDIAARARLRDIG